MLDKVSFSSPFTLKFEFFFNSFNFFEKFCLLMQWLFLLLEISQTGEILWGNRAHKKGENGHNFEYMRKKFRMSNPFKEKILI